jgi:hypothetical protein
MIGYIVRGSAEDHLRQDPSIRLKHRQGALVIEAPGAHECAGRIDRALVRAVCLVRGWAKSLASRGCANTMRRG